MTQNTVSRPIGGADMEHYYGGVVHRMAMSLAGLTDDREFSNLSYETRKKWLDKAVAMACDVFNDRFVAEHLHLLADNIRGRI